MIFSETHSKHVAPAADEPGALRPVAEAQISGKLATRLASLVGSQE